MPWTGSRGITESVAEINARQQATPPKPFKFRIREEFEYRRPAKPNPLAPEVSHWPPSTKDALIARPEGIQSPQAAGVNFLGTQISDGPGYLPPDAVGSVGPTQVVVAANGRIKVFDKTGGLGPLNVDPDVFFASVLPPGTQGTSDPRVHYDRLSGRWYISIISVDTPNRILLAVSSGATITGSGSFTFFYFAHDSVGTIPNSDTGGFLDYETLGIDANALYIGGNVFNAAGTAYLGTTGFVVRKSSVLGAGPIVVTAFRQLATSSGAGPYTPQGVDNDDPAATEGYFIGVDNANFSLLQIRRVSTPGGTPSLSGNLSVTVPTTAFPRTVPALGSTRPLDGIDDRLFNATIKNGTLWTVHNINVTNAGVATGTAGTTGRNAARWYELENLTTTPSLRQSGTLFDNATVTSGTARQTWMPSIAVSGQNHVVIPHSISAPTNNLGSQLQASVGHGGRLATDPLGAIQTTTVTTTSSSNYNAQTSGTQRWGDYSFANVDPNDNMTIWSFAEYCNSTNSWGVRATQLLAPPPATPSSASPSTVNTGSSNMNVTITGTAVSGSGFYDPGAAFPRHISASVSGSGVTVNSVTYTDPTHVILNINVSAGAATGARTVTIMNPDSQSTASASGILTITTSGCPSITLSPSVLPNTSVGTPYGQTITASGGIAPYTFSVSTGSLPTGLTLSLGGSLSGTPTAGGTFNFTVMATDDSNCTGSQAYSITITCPTITVSPASLPNGTQGVAYSQNITASGGSSPYTYAVTSGSLPAGLSLSSGGLLSGTPSSSGVASFTITATDSQSCTGARAYSLTIDPGTGSSISLSAMNVAYTQDFNSLASTGTSSTLPTGWLMSESGTNANTTYAADIGSTNAGNTYSYGAASNSERALGGLQSGSLNPTLGASFANNTGSTITSLLVTYMGEQWRIGATSRVDRIDFQLSTDAVSLSSGTYTDVDSLDFTAPVTSAALGALDGNSAPNRTSVNYTINGLSIPNGAVFYIRWNDFNATGADDGLAVDDFSITPQGIASTKPSGTGSANPSSVVAGNSS
ncbi:MAG TPA: Ig domain-containing protein, partial [Bacteroidota bacterium]|nr:Ig domain-containing protein [Bacteroidota bacterium]